MTSERLASSVASQGFSEASFSLIEGALTEGGRGLGAPGVGATMGGRWLHGAFTAWTMCSRGDWEGGEVRGGVNRTLGD